MMPSAKPETETVLLWYLNIGSELRGKYDIHVDYMAHRAQSALVQWLTEQWDTTIMPHHTVIAWRAAQMLRAQFSQLELTLWAPSPSASEIRESHAIP